MKILRKTANETPEERSLRKTQERQRRVTRERRESRAKEQRSKTETELRVLDSGERNETLEEGLKKDQENAMKSLGIDLDEEEPSFFEKKPKPKKVRAKRGESAQ